MQTPPPLQVSLVVHALPSLQAVPLGTTEYTHPVAALHVSVVQELPSKHTMIEPREHTPAPLQKSPAVQALLSLHAPPAASNVHVGEQQSPAALLPSSHASPASSVPLPHGPL